MTNCTSGSDETPARSMSDTDRGKCAYCRGAIVAEEPRETDDGLCCWHCWQFIPVDADGEVVR